ncbi:MAG: histidine kinase [Acidithiobacillales bacterium SM1_46]|jgi:two-component system nitrogen regulation sensor histidine kinase GlnL|nr:MAG: histidine kinase [Acidithiobacillales bacterium SM1_46]
MLPDSPQRILESLSTAVLVFDVELRLVSINPAGEMLLAASARKLTGLTLNELIADGKDFAKVLTDTLRSRHPFTARSVRLRLFGGQAVTVDCAVTPLPEGTAGGALLVELSQIDRLLRLAREELMRDRQTANRAVLRGLAHEIKNPLGGLRGAAQLLERELAEPSLNEYTQIIIHEADRLRNLVDRMVGPARPYRREPVNIHEVLERVRRLVLAEHPGGLRFECDFDPSLPELAGDAEQLIQAALNIVRNAVQAMQGDGTIVMRTRIERNFTIGGKRHRLIVRVDIEDNGPGIPPALQEHVFYPMVTGRPEGTGLGLSIAQDIAQRHGGLIECVSRPGHTVFTLYLPVESEHD